MNIFKNYSGSLPRGYTEDWYCGRANYSNVQAIDFVHDDDKSYCLADIRQWVTATDLRQLRFKHCTNLAWVIRELQPVQNTLCQLDIEREFRSCNELHMWGTRQDLDFLLFHKFTVLKVPASAWTDWVVCFESTGRGWRWNMAGMTFDQARLPPYIQDLTIRFHGTNGVFAIGEDYRATFKDLGGEEQLRACEWIVRLMSTRKRWLRKLTLIECAADYCPVAACVPNGDRGRTVEFVPPKKIMDAFEEAGVKLEIRLLDLVLPAVFEVDESAGHSEEDDTSDSA